MSRMLRGICITKDPTLQAKNLLKLHTWYVTKMKILNNIKPEPDTSKPSKSLSRLSTPATFYLSSIKK